MNKLKEYRKKKKLSQVELANKVGVTWRFIAFIEAGQKTPSLAVGISLAQALGTSVEEIFLP